MPNAPAKIHAKPPFRAEHVGSLIRPRPLYEKRCELEEGKCSVEDLKEVEDDAVKHVVELQRSLGIRSITDGEVKKASFYDGVFEKLEGMVFMPARPLNEFKRYMPHIAMLYAAGLSSDATFYCNGKIKRTKPFYVDEFKALKKVVSPEEVKNIKINMCAPGWWHHRHGSDLSYDVNVYKNDTEFFDDLGAAYREEFEELYELGCRNIQLDDPVFAFFCYPPTTSGMKEAGEDPEALLDTYIYSINTCTKNRPKDLHVAVHICRGNYKGLHFCEGGYAPIAEKVFNELDVDSLFLEFDDERSGDFAPLKHVPLNKNVVLGLVTSKTSNLESIDECKRSRAYDSTYPAYPALGIPRPPASGTTYSFLPYITYASRFLPFDYHLLLIVRSPLLCRPLPIQRVSIKSSDSATAMETPLRSKEAALNQLCISPQCGFASVWQGNPITEEDQKKKLELIVETAKQVWQDSE